MSQSQSSHMMNINDLKELRSLPGNTRCIDCDRNKPDWASVTLGIFICLECSGQHRSLGTHISFVRSVRMDSWTDKQIKRMKISGGNNACRDFLEKHGIDTTVSLINNINNNKTSTSISNKYRTPQGQLYQHILNARMDGQPEPTELPPPAAALTTTNNNNNEGKDNGNGNGDNEDNEKKDYNAIRSSSNATTSNSTSNTSSSQVGSAVKIMEGFGSAPHPNSSESSSSSEKLKRGGGDRDRDRDRRAKKIIMNVSMAIGRFKNNAINAAAAAVAANKNNKNNNRNGGGGGSSGLSGKL
jgi:hypothetical protein